MLDAVEASTATATKKGYRSDWQRLPPGPGAGGSPGAPVADARSEPTAGQVRGRRECSPLARSWCSERRGQYSSSCAALADAVTSSAMASALRRVSLLTQSTCTASASVTARASCCVVARW